MTFARSDLAEAPAAQASRTVPFDYAFRFELKGKPGETARRKITISVEAGFTAVSVGYGVVATAQPVRFGLMSKPPAGPTIAAAPRGGVLGAISIQDLIDSLDSKSPDERDLIFKTGFRLSSEVASRSLTGVLSPNVLSEAFEAIAAPPERVQFTYALFDDGTGREFQSEPILNIAGLGAADGGRPFRYFARPIEFSPMSVIRMEITEIQTVRGDLHVSLHGYKTLGATTPAASPQHGRARRRR